MSIAFHDRERKNGYSMGRTDAVRRLFGSDVVVYFGSGLLTILVFAVAVVAVDWYLPVDLLGGSFQGLTTGFGVFMAIYFVSFGIWYYLRRWGDSDWVS